MHTLLAFCIGNPTRGNEPLQGIHNDVLTFVTPVIMLDMSDLTVLRQATCFRFPCQTARVTLLLLPLTKRTSMLIWRMFFVSSPRGPVTTITRDLTATVTPSGISSSSVLRMSRIYKVGIGQHMDIYFMSEHPSDNDHNSSLISTQTEVKCSNITIPITNNAHLELMGLEVVRKRRRGYLGMCELCVA